AAVALLAGAAVWPALARPAALAVLASNGYLGWNLWRALRLQPRLQPAY
ncbi:MAG TPA: amino acid permease, partial [Janthinobacterium sp.]|nr:amino acid permease [Janthinobacterium sp.]